MAVQFEEPQVPLSMKVAQPAVGSVTRLVMSLGLAKTARDAQIVMIVLAVLMLAGAMFVFFSLSTPSNKSLSQEELQQVLQDGIIRH